jgi:hypothetical protein
MILGDIRGESKVLGLDILNRLSHESALETKMQRQISQYRNNEQ